MELPEVRQPCNVPSDGASTWKLLAITAWRILQIRMIGWECGKWKLRAAKLNCSKAFAPNQLWLSWSRPRCWYCPAHRLGRVVRLTPRTAVTVSKFERLLSGFSVTVRRCPSSARSAGSMEVRRTFASSKRYQRRLPCASDGSW